MLQSFLRERLFFRSLVSVVALLSCFFCPLSAYAQDLLSDVNGDGVVKIAAFGDSVTRGTGDYNSVGAYILNALNPSGEAGYPLRVERLLGVPVANLGQVGESCSDTGIYRFASVVPGLDADVVVISEGINDADSQTNPQWVYLALQAMINITRASGKTPVLATITPACCVSSTIGYWVTLYNPGIRELAVVNDIALADINHAYTNTCNAGNCYLLNLPEGLHPNSSGYDVSAEAVLAAMLGIPLFSPDGAAQLETALNLAPGSVITKPDPVTPSL